VQLGIARSYDRFMASSDPQQITYQIGVVVVTFLGFFAWKVLWIPNQLA